MKVDLILHPSSFFMFMRVSTSLKAFGEVIKMQPGLLEAGWDVPGVLARSFWTIGCRGDSRLTQSCKNVIIHVQCLQEFNINISRRAEEALKGENLLVSVYKHTGTPAV